MAEEEPTIIQPTDGKPTVQGTVKWFSNKKGYGFITPVEGSSTIEDVFVHQSSIHSDGFRTLDEGWVVEFTLGDDDGGRVKAETVTAPGGGPCTGPSRRRERNRRGPRNDEDENHNESEGEGDQHRENNEESNENGGGRARRRGNPRGPPKPKEPFWHLVLSEDVTSSLETKGIRTTTGTIDVSVGPSRIKLGTGGYASIAHADGILAEGTFTADADGIVSLSWDKCIEFVSGEWITKEGSFDLATTTTLLDDAVIAVQPDESSLTLWGDTPSDPVDALEANEFKMRRVVLTPKQGGRRRRQ